MHVAGLELCKELYAVSGWDDEQLDHQIYSYPNSTVNNTVQFPIYSLDYLLRKLPVGVLLYKGVRGYTFSVGNSIQHSSRVYDVLRGNNFRSDTPEDAAAKLCIELFKQDILTPERK